MRKRAMRPVNMAFVGATRLVTCLCCGAALPDNSDCCEACDNLDSKPDARPFRKPFKGTLGLR